MSGFHLYSHAAATPNKIAYKMVPSGQTVTFGALEARSNQCAHLLRRHGLTRGDCVAILLENHIRYFELAWAADRAGLYYTAISSRLTVPELSYIIGNCGAAILFVSAATLPLAREALADHPGCTCYLVDGEGDAQTRDYVTERDAFPETPITDQSSGAAMLYSSGTTGRPKGVKFELPNLALDECDPLTRIGMQAFGMNKDSIYLSPTPLYHSAPLRWGMTIHRLGGTVVVMEKFDPEQALQLIESERINCSQWVPTHFVRMLKLPDEVRSRYDLSSHTLTFHAAAPCPVAVKDAMIKWWGPIIHEYYSGTEFIGMTTITPEEWLSHKGSVGRPIFGKIHICADDGVTELPVRSDGLVYFSGGSGFSYHGDPEKTASAYNAIGWSTLGDIGWVDQEGYLYLTDRKSFMIISGGVNIFPQEIEDALIGHPQVADVAVVGAPDEDLGERIVAVIQPMDWADAGPALVSELRTYLDGKFSRIKMPKQFDFMAELPRHATGKLYKRILRDEYWKQAERAD